MDLSLHPYQWTAGAEREPDPQRILRTQISCMDQNLLHRPVLAEMKGKSQRDAPKKSTTPTLESQVPPTLDIQIPKTLPGNQVVEGKNAREAGAVIGTSYVVFMVAYHAKFLGLTARSVPETWLWPSP